MNNQVRPIRDNAIIYSMLLEIKADKSSFQELEKMGQIKKVGSEVEGSVTVYACPDKSEILLGNEGTYWTREEYQSL